MAWVGRVIGHPAPDHSRFRRDWANGRPGFSSICPARP
jgi:hypothetical protein